MKQGYRRGFSTAEKTELWDRWQRGESMRSIGRVVGKPSSSIYFQLAPYGGIRPAPRRRSRLALSLLEREEISRGIVAQQSTRSIAKLLGRSPSTVSRELSRNGGYDRYRATLADKKAWDSALRPKRCKLARHPPLCRAVARKLQLNWSPEQIAGWLKRLHPGDGSYQVSHETIYRSLFVQARGVLKKELLQHLRSKRTNFRSKHISQKGEGQGQIKDMISIRERPASVEDRAVPGHWEGDLITGSNNSHIATLVERHTRYLMLVKVTNKETQTVVSALIKQAKKLPTELYKSLTWDRGKELSAHKQFTLVTDIDVYFCDPQSPWQRGSNENTNGLLRQ
jgi:IS30 family transposase